MSMPQWKANANKESLKLSPKESDWQLPGMERTAGKRTPKKQQFLGDSDSNSSYSADDDFSSSEEEDFEDGGMPCEDRLIVEKRALQALVEKYAKCPKCNTEMMLLFETMTLAVGANK